VLTASRDWSARADARGQALEGATTIHTVILDWFSLWARRRQRGERIDWFLAFHSPATRLDALGALWGAWCVVGVAFLVATIVLVGPIWLVFGYGATRIVAVPGFAACWFCFAGVPYALWRRSYASRAKRRATKHGPTDALVRRYMLRAIPRNDSIVLQSGVAVIVICRFVFGL
jgi:hypothetical protein